MLKKRQQFIKHTYTHKHTLNKSILLLVNDMVKKNFLFKISSKFLFFWKEKQVYSKCQHSVRMVDSCAKSIPPRYF